MLRIRLSRVGKKKQPSYRIVVADSRAPRGGAFLEIIGHYNPLTDPATVVVKEEQAVRWLQQGAQPSDTAAKLLTRLGVMEKAGLAPVVYERKTIAPKKKAAEAAPTPPQPAASPPAPPKAPAATEPAAAEAEPPVAEPEAAAPEVEAEAPAAEVEAAAPEEPAAEGPETQEQPEPTE
ncbi:MAG TPA: 30S ribosomal protein S16 [Dehalococcoidia bacterium]|nr:30S ribosomal protein S16 [Dehalococcoidia bacterium]